MRSRIVLVAALVALSGCASDDNTDATPEPPRAAPTTTEAATTAPTTTKAAPPSKRTRSSALEAHLRKYLPLGMGSVYAEIFSITVTDKVLLTTRSADPKFPYRAACQTALDLASEHSGVTAVEVRDVDYVLKSSSVGRDACDKRY